MLLILQQNINTFLLQSNIFYITSLDIYYCVQLKKELLTNRLRHLQELTLHFCASAARNTVIKKINNTPFNKLNFLAHSTNQ